jgi:hypothetical protein
MSLKQKTKNFRVWIGDPGGNFFFFSFIFLGVFVYIVYLCRPPEASTWCCVIPGGYPPQDWQSLPCAREELDLNPGLLICSQVCYHWATSPPKLSHFSSPLSHLSSKVEERWPRWKLMMRKTVGQKSGATVPLKKSCYCASFVKASTATSYVFTLWWWGNSFILFTVRLQLCSCTNGITISILFIGFVSIKEQIKWRVYINKYYMYSYI